MEPGFTIILFLIKNLGMTANWKAAQ